MEAYKVKFFYDLYSGKSPVEDYIEALSGKEQTKVVKYIEFLRQSEGVLDEPWTKRIRGKIRELRVDFAKNRHRIFFFTFIGRNIILLHAFQKRTAQTPDREIIKAMTNYQTVINNPRIYEK